MQAFEESLGMLLYICYESLEAVQTSDLESVVGHVEMVLRNALSVQFESPSQFRAKQEVLVFGYLSHFLSRSPKINDEQLGRDIVDREIFPLSVSIMSKFGQGWSRNDQFMAAEALSQIVESDFFKSRREAFWSDHELRQAFIGLNGESAVCCSCCEHEGYSDWALPSLSYRSFRQESLDRL